LSTFHTLYNVLILISKPPYKQELTFPLYIFGNEIWEELINLILGNSYLNVTFYFHSNTWLLGISSWLSLSHLSGTQRQQDREWRSWTVWRIGQGQHCRCCQNSDSMTLMGWWPVTCSQGYSHFPKKKKQKNRGEDTNHEDIQQWLLFKILLIVMKSYILTEKYVTLSVS
jgi:hypothetical protein